MSARDDEPLNTWTEVLKLLGGIVGIMLVGWLMFWLAS